MKKSILLAMLSSVLAFGAINAYADHEAGHESAHKAKVDADGDGKVSYDEYRASNEKKSERQFKRMDTNGDGFIDAAEKQAQKDKMQAMRQKRKSSQ